MKVKLKLVGDSWNSYPRDELEFSITDDCVSFTVVEANTNFGPTERILTVDRREFERLLKFLAIE